METIGRSEYTVRSAKYGLNDFLKFLEKTQVYMPDDLTEYFIDSYQQDLAFRATNKGTILSLRSQSLRMSMIKTFTRFLHEKSYLANDPGRHVKLPKKSKTLPKEILSSKEIKKSSVRACTFHFKVLYYN